MGTWTNAIITNFRQEPWGKDGAEHLKADVEFPDSGPAGCVGQFIFGEPEKGYSGVVVLGNGKWADWFWESSCREVESGLNMDLDDTYEQHQRRLEAGKEGL